jgi:hypothetical protein
VTTESQKVAINCLVMCGDCDQWCLMVLKETENTAWGPWVARIIVRLGVVVGFIVLIKFGIDLLFAKFALFESSASARDDGFDYHNNGWLRPAVGDSLCAGG